MANDNLFNINMNDILLTVLSLFKIPDVAPPPVPPPLVLLSGQNPGLSARKIAARIISRQEEAGAPSGPLPSGKPNISEKMELIRVEEMIKALQQDSKITVVIPPGSYVTTLGANAGGPVVSVGATTYMQTGNAVIQ